MILNSILFYALILPVGISIAIPLGFMVKFFIPKFGAFTKDEIRVYTLIGRIIIGIVSMFIIYNKANDLVVVNPNGEIEKYTFLGRIDFSIDNITYVLKREPNKTCFIINKTNRLLVYESLDYGEPLFNMPILFESVDGLEPDSMTIRKELPNYYPWENPPNSIKVQQYVKWKSKYWLHFASQHEKEVYYNKESLEGKYDYLFE